MTVLFIEGFEQYGDAIGVERRWSTNFDTEAPGRFGYGRCGRFQGQEASLAIRPDGAAIADFSFGMALKFTDNAFAGNNRPILGFWGGANSSRQFSVFTKTDGTIGVCRNDNLSLIQGTPSAPGTLTIGSWDYFEFCFHHDNTSDTGSNFAIKKNGVIVSSGTGVNMRDGSNLLVDTCRWRFEYRTYVDDAYVVDSFTSLGEQRVFSMVPTADTADKDFTASSGSDNFAMVDELPFNTSDYVAASAAGALDLYDLTNLPYVPASVAAVQTHMMIAKDDATERTARAVMKSGASIANGPTIGVPSSYGYVRGAILETDPATSAPWTASAINALQAGIEVVS